MQSELRQAEKGFPKRTDGADDAVGGQPLRQRVVVRLQLNIVSSAVVHLYITDDWGPIPRLIGKSKRRNRIQGRKHIALPGDQGSAKRGIKIIFCRETPGEELLGLTIRRLAEETLGDSRFDFARIRDCVVLVEANDSAKIL